jgi:hypothetical protein
LWPLLEMLFKALKILLAELPACVFVGFGFS